MCCLTGVIHPHLHGYTQRNESRSAARQRNGCHSRLQRRTTYLASTPPRCSDRTGYWSSIIQNCFLSHTWNRRQTGIGASQHCQTQQSHSQSQKRCQSQQNIQALHNPDQVASEAASHANNSEITGLPSPWNYQIIGCQNSMSRHFSSKAAMIRLTCAGAMVSSWRCK